MIKKLDNAIVGMACISLFAVMCIVGIDALGRNLVNTPITGAYVLIEEYLMPAMIFPLIGYVWITGAHVKITLLRNKFPAPLRKGLRAMDVLLGLGVFGLTTYVGFHNTLDAYLGAEVTSGLIRWPVWLALVWMPLGCGLFCLHLVIELIFRIGNEPDEPEDLIE